MKVAGIISEWNPFHSGHAHLIQSARRLCGADFVVAVMSGDFVQRGEPALFDKYKRTEQALNGGADLVFELPVRFCLSSAGDFAQGGILALSSLSFVTDLYFGSECGDIVPIMETAKILACENEKKDSDFTVHLQHALKNGLSYPAARASALAQLYPAGKDILAEPNNTLGVEYCLALLKQSFQNGCPSSLSPDAGENGGQPKLALSPHTIRREGQHYNDREHSEEKNCHPSASSLRQHIFHSDTPHLRLDDCSDVIGYTLLREENLTKYKDISEDLAARMKKCSQEYHSAEDFVHKCQTRTFTESRIRRALLQCVLGLTKTDLCMPYLRLLGMNERAGILFKKCRENPASPIIITKLSSDIRKLDAHSLALLQKDILASDWYRQMWRIKYGECMPNEYQQSVRVHRL